MGALAVSLTTALAPQALAGDSEPEQQSAAALGRQSTVVAYDDAAAQRTWVAEGKTVRIFRVELTAEQGQRLVIEANLPLTVPATATDAHLAAVGTASCGPLDAGSATRMTLARNVLRGSDALLHPGMVYAVPVTGEHWCEVTVKTGRPRPNGEAKESNVVTVREGAYLRVSAAHPRLAEAFRPDLKSPVGRRSAYFTTLLGATVPSTIGVRRPAAIPVSLATYVTSCTSESGSWDPVAGAYACSRDLVRYRGTRIQWRLTLVQGGSDACRAPITVLDEVVEVSRDVHHLPRWKGLRLTPRPGCHAGKVTLSYRVREDTPAMVHRSGTLLRLLAS